MKGFRAAAIAAALALGILALGSPADAAVGGVAKSAVSGIASEAAEVKAEPVHYRYRRHYYAPRVYFYSVPRYYYRPHRYHSYRRW